MEEPIFYYTLHQKMWNILADNPFMSRRKALEKYFTEEEREKFGEHECTACAYANKYKDTEHSCNYCPLDTSNVLDDHPELKELKNECNEFLDGRGECLDGLSLEWSNLTWRTVHDADVKELCSKYARAIANLKPKKGVVFK